MKPAAQAPAESPRDLCAASFHHLAGRSLDGLACAGTACFLARRLNPARWRLAEGQTPRLHCLGKCFAAPAAANDAPARPRVESAARTSVVLRRLLQGGAPTLAACRATGGYAGWEAACKRRPEDVIVELDRAGLRGRGGAGFPVGRKWRAAAAQAAAPKFIVANADEGDPGAYIDRFLMEEDPHALIEGMLIAGYAVGAGRGWIYLRCEYPGAKASLEAALAEARGAGLLGPHALGRGRPFEIVLHMGEGGYVCGEETSLLHSLEGRRPEVALRPPYATEHGLFRRPTVVNNVESLACVPWISEHGGGSYRDLGFSKSRGTKVLSLNSLFRRPGLYEVEFGIPLRRVVDELGGGLIEGEEIKGLIVGGPLAGILPPALLDTPLGFEEMRAVGASVGHGGVIAFGRGTSLPALLHHLFSFAAYESCGKCTPCRLGSVRAEALLARLLHGDADQPDLSELPSIVEALKLTSLCGLGTGLAEFAESALRHYPEEFPSCLR